MSFVVDISNVESNVGQYPDGVYEATIRTAKVDVAKSSGNPMIKLELGIYDPALGEATLRDNLPSTFAAKVKAFWQAFNDFTAEEMAEQPLVTIDDPNDFVGGTILIQLGTQENKDTGKSYKTIVAPWYFPTSRAADLLAVEADSPIA